MRPEIVIAGPPADRDAQRALGIDSYTPPPRSLLMPCDECEQPLWIGPKQQAALTEVGAEAKIRCFGCCVILSDPTDAIENLGGQSGKFKTKFGDFPPSRGTDAPGASG